MWLKNMINMIENDCLKWLWWLSKMTKAIGWHGIINLIFELKIKLSTWIYKDIMKY